MYTSTPSVTGESWPNCFMLKLCQKFGINKTLLPTHLLRQQYAPPDAPPQAAKRRVVAERTTAEAKGRKRSFPCSTAKPPPSPRRLLHETGTGGPVHIGVVYGASPGVGTGP